MMIFRITLEFEWDKGNREKNQKHKVCGSECEETFFDKYKKVLRDPLHSGTEERFILIGKTKSQRLLYIAFTMRSNKIRVISARDLNKKEYYLYEEKN